MPSHFCHVCFCSVSKKLSFPRRMYFLDNYDLAAFTPHTGQAAPVAALPTANAGRAKLAPVSLLHSPKRLAWLLFFQVVGIPGSSDSSKAGAQRSCHGPVVCCTFRYSLLTGNSDMTTAYVDLLSSVCNNFHNGNLVICWRALARSSNAEPVETGRFVSVSNIIILEPLPGGSSAHGVSD